ncbi:hypothetical protein SAMN00790413_06204 [Deinococcus hopiensis KR-140]|uniref:DUF1963 domain-containing protein n=1 Tax=Deinococcus hopiensis KR-140 TaxID=695939 RepID=A0A1W1VUL4_9DEIO|nr:hypothetical protein SAMN00790413_06204 [Deinococcus hopiensis KR-140]
MSPEHSGFPEQLLEPLPDGTWRTRPIDETLTLIHQDPSKALELLLFALHHPTRSDVVIDATVSYVADNDLSTLATAALQVLREHPKHELAQRLVGCIGLQRPTALHPHLQSLFELRPNARTAPETYPWRESADLHLGFLSTYRWNEDVPLGERAAARERLLEVRSPLALQRALAPESKPASLDAMDRFRLQEVGFTLVDQVFEAHYQDGSWHLTFAPEDFIFRSYQDPHHPTWALPSEPEDHAFGGELSDRTCGMCANPLHRLLSLDPVPADLHVSITRLTLATCLSCLGWDGGVLFYQHDANGLPTSLNVQDPPEESEFPAGPLRAARVRLATTPPRWRWQEWGMSNGRENLHRLGGYPSWVQSADYPECPHCAQTMTFVLQLDSNLLTAEGEHWFWGSGGMAYAFWCSGCQISGMHWQCT